MEIKLIFISGSREGETLDFAAPEVITLGRHPKNDVTFDAEKDIRASGKHAEIRLEEGRYVLYDLKSTNGTRVNGQRIEHHVLQDGDVVEFGKGGPQLRCELPEQARGVAMTDKISAAEEALEKGGSVGAKTVQMMISDALAKSRQKSSRFASTTVFMKEIVSQAVTQSSKKLKIAMGSIILLLLLGGGGLIYQNLELKAELQSSVENQRSELATLEGRFRSQLDESKQRSDALQQQLNRAQQDATVGRARLQALQDLLDQERQNTSDLANALQSTRQQLGNLDRMTRDAILSMRSFQDVAGESSESIFLICGFNPATSQATSIGTAFAVRSSGVLLTNGHVAREIFNLQEKFGKQYLGIAIQNKNPGTLYVIRTITVHPQYDPNANYSPDMAALVLDTKGARLKPVQLAPSGEYSSIGEGYEVAVYGFPGITMDPNNPLATLSRGAVGRIVNNQYIQHDCQTSGGNSGSPIFNKKGQVVGIHYSGQGNQIVFVPVPELDANNQPIKNPDGTIKMTLGKRRIKEAVGINIGVRGDVIDSFLRSVP